MTEDKVLNPIYVVESDIVASASNIIDLAFQFGISKTGRLLGIYPVDFIGILKGKVDRTSLKPIQTESFDAACKYLESNSVKNPISINPKLDWLTNVKMAKDAGFVNKVVTANEVKEFAEFNDTLRARLDRSVKFKASSDNYLKHLTNIFIASKYITIVDPYFVKDSQLKLLCSLLDKTSTSNRCIEINIVVSIKEYEKFGETVGSTIKARFNHQLKDSKCKYSGKLIYTIVNDKGNEDGLHERLVLSNLGGLHIDKGFDLKENRNEKIRCLDQDDFDDVRITYSSACIKNKYPGSIQVELL